MSLIFVNCSLCGERLNNDVLLQHIPACYFNKCIAQHVTPLCTCLDCKGVKHHTPNLQSFDALAGSPFSKLPPELLLLILKPFQLSEESFLIRLVCKKWFLLISEKRRSLPLVICHYARQGSLNPIIFLHNLFPKVEIAPQICIHAALNGHLHILEWAFRNDMVYNSITSYAARGGHLHILKWAIARGCPWEPNVFVKAAECGSLEILQYLRDSGCTWKAIATGSFGVESNPCAAAAKHGNLEALQWLRGHDCPWDFRTCSVAAENGHLEVLMWAHTNGCPWSLVPPGFEEIATTSAAKNGHFECLKYAKENGCPVDTQTTYGAARRGQFESLKWLHENGCPWDNRLCGTVAGIGRLDMLKWLREQGAEWGFNIWLEAARGAHLDVMKWMLEAGCPWDNRLCAEPGKSGSNPVKVWKWICQVGCPNKECTTHKAINID